jgi:LPXTG-motif cell wall-anchored protein
MTMLLKGIIMTLTILLFAQAWLTIQALDENRSGNVFTLYNVKGFTRNTMIWSTTIIIIGIMLLGGGMTLAGKKRNTITSGIRGGLMI